MMMQSKFCVWVTGVLFGLNFLVPMVWGQGTHSHHLFQEVTSYNFAISKLPKSFGFPPVGIKADDQFQYYGISNSRDASYLEVRDDRGSGGFNVLLDVSDPTATHKLYKETIVKNESSGTDEVRKEFVPLYKPRNLGYKNFFVATTALKKGSKDGVYYVPGGKGPQDIVAPFDATGLNMRDFKSFTAQGSNFLLSPVMIMNAPHLSTTGRHGEFGMNMNFALKIPRFQPTGNYKMKFTYTLLPN